MIGVVNQYGRLMVKPGVSTAFEPINQKPAKGKHYREILMIGPSNGGDPDPRNPIRSSDIFSFRKILGPDDVPVSVCGEERINPCRMIFMAQHPSKDPDVHGAHYITFIRVGSPTRALWRLEDGAGHDMLDLYSVGFGLDVNAIRPKIEAGAIVLEGRTVTIKDEKESRTYSELGRALRIGYNGSGTEALLHIDVNSADSAIRLRTVIDSVTDLNIDLTRYPTIGSLAKFIASNANYTCEVDPKADPKMPPSYLDPATSVSIKQLTVASIGTVAANTINKTGAFAGLSLAGRWVNPNSTDSVSTRVRIVSHTDDQLVFEGLVDLTAVTETGKSIQILGYGANALLGSIIWTINRNETQRVVASKTTTAVGLYYGALAAVDYTPPTTPGTYPAITISDWQAALQKADRLWVKNGVILPLSHSSSVHRMIDAYCQDLRTGYARDVHGFYGSDLETTVDEAIENARALNSIDATYVYNGIEDDNEYGEKEIFSSLHSAAALAGMYAGSGIFEPLTANNVRCSGLEFRLDPKTDQPRLIENGVTALFVDEESEDSNVAYKVLMALTTYTGSDERMYRVLYPKTVICHINQLLKSATWPIFYGKRIDINRGNSVKNMARMVLFDISQPGKEQLLMANPADPVNEPAFDPPVLAMQAGAGDIQWSGRIVDEGDWLTITGAVQFANPTFQ